MPATEKSFDLASVLAPADGAEPSVPIWLARQANWLREAPLSAAQKTWVGAQRPAGTAGGRHVLVPDVDGGLAGVVLWLGEERGAGQDKPELAIGHLPGLLPAGLYRLEDPWLDAELATVAWGLGAYRFRRYKTSNGGEVARLKPPPLAGRALSILE